eukprot:1159138-Pelagomonas_calceolata.AAC.3
MHAPSLCLFAAGRLTLGWACWAALRARARKALRCSRMGAQNATVFPEPEGTHRGMQPSSKEGFEVQHNKCAKGRAGWEPPPKPTMLPELREYTQGAAMRVLRCSRMGAQNATVCWSPTLNSGNTERKQSSIPAAQVREVQVPMSLRLSVASDANS